MYYWHKNALVCAPTAFNDQLRIDFIIHWQVASDQSGRQKFSRIYYSAANYFGRCDAIIDVHFSSRTQCRRANCIHRIDHRCVVKEAPPACAVTDLRSRTGAKGGVNRGCNRLTVETVLHTCNRQAATPRWKFRVGRIQVGIEHCRRRQSVSEFFVIELSINRVAANHSTRCQRGRK